VCGIKFYVAVNCVHVMLYVCGGGECGIIDNKYIIHVSGIENSVIGVNKVFNVGFLQLL
jgi:hypothetical protein